MQNSSPISFIYGIDFSGSQEACKKIWICESVPTDEGLQIQKCWNIKEKYGNISLNSSLEVLAKFIASSPRALFGLDFPFGLPESLLIETGWETFIQRFHKQYKDPDQFFEHCHTIAGGKEPKRTTDKERSAPWSPINLKLYKQTYYGINSILYPLIRDSSASILPMQLFNSKKSLVIEICPASTLKAEKLYLNGYKRGGEETEGIRERILDVLIEKKFLREISQSAKKAALENTGGDALDSIIAAVAAHRALKNNFGVPENRLYKLEGYIYV